MTGSGASARGSDDDLFLLTMVGFLTLGGVAAAAVTGWADTVSWLLAHQVLVPAAEHPLLTVPGSVGAGLDVPRLALAVAAALLAFAGVAGAARRHLARGELR